MSLIHPRPAEEQRKLVSAMMQVGMTTEKETLKIGVVISMPRQMGENTLTIEVSKEIIQDVFQDPHWPLFSLEKAVLSRSIPVLTLISFVAKSKQPADLALLDSACGLSLLPMLFENKRLAHHWKIWLFVAHSSWQRKSRVTLHKKLWNSFLGEGIESFRRQTELMFESSEGIRFAGLAEVTASNFLLAVQLMRRHGCTLLISKREDVTTEKNIDFMFRSAYPKHKGIEQATVDIAAFSLNVCPLGDIVIRIAGSYDERCSSLDCVVSADNSNVLV